MSNHSSIVKNLLKNSFTYSIATILTKALYLILTPIYTSVFSTAVFGVFSVINSSFFFISSLLVFSLDYAAGRWYFDSDDANYRRSIFSNWFVFQFGLTILVAFLYFLAPANVLDKLFNTDGVADLLLYPILTLFFNVPITIMQNYLRFKQDSKRVAIFSVLNGVVTSLFIIATIYLRKPEIKVVLFAQFISTIIFSLWACYSIRHLISIKFIDLRQLLDMLKFATPLVPSGLSFWMLNSGALFFINHTLGSSQAGLYGLALSLSAIVSIFTGAFSSAWGPFVMNLVKSDRDAPNTIGQIFSIYSVLCNLLWLCFAIYSNEIILLLANASYLEGSLVMAFLSLNFFIYSYSYFTKLGNDLNKRSMPLSIAMIAGAILSAVLYWILIPKYGILGASIASLLGQLCIPIIVYFPAQQFYPVHFDFLKVFLHTFVVLFLGVIIHFYSSASLSSIFIRMVVLLATLGLSYLGIKNEIIALMRTKKIDI